MKTPEEIKKGLSCCSEDSHCICKDCPYGDYSIGCIDDLGRDALELIKQYEERLIND